MDALARAGARALYSAAGAGTPLARAVAGRGLPVVTAGSPALACAMAAVAAVQDEAPGAALIPGAAALDAGAGLAHAATSRAPLVVLTDDLPEATRDALAGQVKASVVAEAATAAHWAAHALQCALGGPPGPVHLEVPAAQASRPALPVATAVRPAPLAPPDPRALDEAAGRLARAARPAVVAGVACRRRDAAPWLRAFVEGLSAPAVVTPHARGVLPDPHPLVLGVLGEASEVLARADLLVAVGVDAGEWRPVAPAPVLGLGPAPCPGAVLDVIGDVGAVLEELAPRVRGVRADWDVAALDRAKRSRRVASPRAPLDPAEVARVVRSVAPPATVATVEPSPALAPIAGAWEIVEPAGLVTSEVVLPGFAVAAGLAAGVARGARPVVCFTTPEGLAASQDALTTAAARSVALVALVLGGDAGPPAGVTRVTVTAAASVGPAAAAALARPVPTVLVIAPV